VSIGGSATAAANSSIAGHGLAAMQLDTRNNVAVSAIS
jgi:hypothetical protein